MARRSLRPELNRIRAWVRQGRTDAWIAHQLEVTVQQIQTFKREHGLAEANETEAAGVLLGDYDDEIDLRAEDDALVAAELAAAEAREAEERAGGRRMAAKRAAGGAGAGGAGGVAPAVAGAARSRPRLTMARRATGCGWTPPSRTTRSTPSTGRATAPSR